jgi:hypothetical protein
VLALVLVVAGCAGSDGRLTGTVVGFEASGDSVDAFEVLASNGNRITFQVPETLTEFEHGGPLTHLLQHLQSGAPVEVTYHREGDAYVADAVSDG